MAEKVDVAAFEKDKHAMDKYSRQIGEYGVAAMAKLVQMKVLIIGLKGVGIEVAKNLILAGVGSVTLFDDDLVKISDLGTNFYLSEEHVGKVSCAKASLPQLKSLNPLVNVEVLTKRLTNKDIKKFTVVVDCGLSMSEGLICNEQCRKMTKEGVKYLRSRVHGLVGYIFNDFGNEFKIVDRTGEAPVSRVIDRIETNPENAQELIVRLIAEKRHNIDFDDHVNFIKFSEIEGELGLKLNDKEKPFTVKENTRKKTDGTDVFDPYSLKVETGDLGLGDLHYTGSGQILQVKKAVSETYKPLAQSLLNPLCPPEAFMMFTDGAKFDRPGQLHIALNGLWRYEKKYKKIPAANDKEAVQEIVALAKAYNEEMKATEGNFSVEEVDVATVEKLARFAECNFQPLCTFFGGVVAQEVIKYTGKYTPLRQWLHVDCFEVLPEECVDEDNPDLIKVDDADREPVESRYDDLIKILGRTFHQKIMQSSTFMVGCGALGCELLKNFALLGLACDDSKKGLITVTDNDSIEISNLSRQFLFREDNVGQPKSLAAQESVKKMNEFINVKSLEHLVSPASEGIFDADFWQAQDFITNALDNVKARKYVDSQCVFYSKALLESGTLGTKCNSQVIIPHLTQSYSDIPDDDLGDAIPMCTLRNFPSQIEHCIEWARAKFTDYFETEATKAANFVKDPAAYIKEMKDKTSDLSAVSKEIPVLEKVIHILKTSSDPNTTFDLCVEEAFAEFHVLFRDNILALIRAKPADAVDDEGDPFWGKNRRFPQAAEFDPENETHVLFLLSMANVLSMNYGLVKTNAELEKDLKKVIGIASKLTPPPVANAKVDLSEGEKKDLADTNEVEEFNNLIAQLEEIASSEILKNASIEPASFEKDDDSNFHIDFITAATNLRAWNYTIKQAPRHKCKLIAGKIIPALATTTAAVTGLVCIELLKVLQPGKTLAAFKDSSNSLGVNMFQFMEPSPPNKAQDEYDPNVLAEVKCLPPGFTNWDKTVIEGGDLTLREFMAKYKETVKEKFDKDLEITLLYHSNAEIEGMQGFGKILYTDDPDVENNHLDKPLKETLLEFYGENAIGNTRVQLQCNVNDSEGDPYKLPQLVYLFG